MVAPVPVVAGGVVEGGVDEGGLACGGGVGAGVGGLDEAKN